MGRRRRFSLPPTGSTALWWTGYVKPWRDVLIKRALATALYLMVALAVAGAAVGIGKIIAQ